METGHPEVEDTRPPLYVVLITGKASTGKDVRGTGFIVDTAGHVVTCRHVVYPTPDDEPVTELRVMLPYPAREPCSYQVLATSPDDLAILEPTVELGYSLQQCKQYDQRRGDPRPGDRVIVWGYSAAEHYTQAQRFDCVVSGLSAQHGRIGLNGDVNFGDSGGPVLDVERNLVGIAQARDAKRSGQAMAIPASLLRALMHRHGLAPASAAETADDRVFEVPPTPDYALVGRDALFKNLKEQLTHGRHVALCFRPGVGKSALAKALANDQDVRDSFDVELWADLNLRPNVLSELKKWGSYLGLKPEKIEQIERMATDAADGEQATERMTEAWGRALAKQIGQRRALLVIDDAWDIEPAMAMLLPAENCAYLITTREPAKVAENLRDKDFDVRVLDDLEPEDGVALLRQIAPNAVDMFPDEARKIFDAVGGLPQGLLLLGKVLKQESREKQRRRIERAYHDIAERLSEKLEPVERAIKVGFDRLPDDEARDALCELSIFRPKPGKFTEEAALAVLRKPAAVLYRLLDSGLIELVEESDDPEHRPYTMHRTIADFAERRLGADGKQKHALHRRAADHYTHWLTTYDKSEHKPGRYGHQYRYEKPAWQDAMDDFLYHLARSGDPAAAIVDFASIYFNAFWWWGCYAEFRFCTRLLEQAASKRLSPEGRHALELLCDFDAAYPKESARAKGDDWSRVERSLVEMRRLGGLDREPDTISGEARRYTRALTDIFLAEALRFGRAEYAEAERLYRDALAMLPADDWSVPWVHYHLGDLFLDRGHFDESAQQCARCLALAEASGLVRKDRDNEVIANGWRLCAELAARSKDRVATLEGLQRMVLHAYAFQAIPEPPDPYTVLFYGHIVARAVLLLQSLHRSDPGFAVECCDALRAYWSSYREVVREGRTKGEAGAELEHARTPAELTAMLEAPGPDALAAWLFPPAPCAGDMHQKGSRYFNEAITIFNEKMGVEAVSGVAQQRQTSSP